ncbi:ADQ_G0006540.mRNA.1.CDS.1 [Saccharomyces cerevisiae]|nr:ADQ_G0006540.mRNA.1.CDS.1 [Saccharomyces cerevisiae]CAI6526379.1 ADQ_G0006540.mRNA.1.CDS.1 [Saccharomyces cerevisiae]
MYYPSNSSECQKTVLPQDLFRSSFTWFCYEIYKSLVFRIWMLYGYHLASGGNFPTIG